ncbi:MAG: metallophosphoesterase [Candidatus Micrarchaeota archaeon]|nr:metallophosphoesterase [Candidatus Micrarchaeota archaeon]
MMRLNSDVELLDGMPIAHIRSLSMIVVSDLHLGYESHMAKRGTLIPKVNLKRIVKDLGKAIDTTGAKTILIDGDIKNEFSRVEEDEFNEFYDIVQLIKKRGLSLILIKGNHDNFIERYREPFGIKVFRQQAEINGYLFFHGEELPDVKKDTRMLIMGHEHPSIGIYTTARKEKVRCFLYGSYKRKPLLVLPAMGYFAQGTDVNLEPKGNLLSPIFKHVDIDRMEAIALGYGSTMSFGSVGKLRSARP